MDEGAWWAAVHGVAKSWTRLSDFTFTFYFHELEKEIATHSSVLAWRIPGMGTEVQPRWIQGDSKVGGQSRCLWKNTYLITDIERLEMDSIVGRSVEKRRLNNLDYVE